MEETIIPRSARTESHIPFDPFFFFLLFLSLPPQGNRRSEEARETQHFSKSHNHVYRNEITFIRGHWRNDLTGQSFSTGGKNGKLIFHKVYVYFEPHVVREWQEYNAITIVCTVNDHGRGPRVL